MYLAETWAADASCMLASQSGDSTLSRLAHGPQNVRFYVTFLFTIFPASGRAELAIAF